MSELSYDQELQLRRSFIIPPTNAKFDDLSVLLRNKTPESEILDYKSEFGKDWMKHAAAFLNQGGGQIIFGVEEKNMIPVGLPGVQRDTIENALKISNFSPNPLDKSLFWTIIDNPTDSSKAYVIITLLNPQGHLYLYDNSLFLRRGVESKKILYFAEFYHFEPLIFDISESITQYFPKPKNRELYEYLVAKYDENLSLEGISNGIVFHFIRRLHQFYYIYEFEFSDLLLHNIKQTFHLFRELKYNGPITKEIDFLGIFSRIVENIYYFKEFDQMIQDLKEFVLSEIQDLILNEVKENKEAMEYLTSIISNFSLPEFYSPVLFKILEYYAKNEQSIYDREKRILLSYSKKYPIKFEMLLEELYVRFPKWMINI